jgi:glycosyltransferase involved in cell wall biosynthesis
MIEARMATAADAFRVCVAIPTFRRPELLRSLLEGIAVQVVPGGVTVEVLVIDNDVQPSVDEIVAALRDAFPFTLRYVHLAEPGLCSVRNFALSYAREFTFLAMIDDDEYPKPCWLAELLRVQCSTGADAVVGPVPRNIPASAPRWLRSGRFYDLPLYPDGSSITFGYSGNCLLRVSSLRRFGVVFDSELNFAGGEDLLFFRTLVARGAKMAFAAHAVASEWVGPERLSASYLLRLSFRRGNTLTICDRRLNGTVAGLATRALKGCARLSLGLATLLPRSLIQGRAGAMRALCDMAQGFGSLTGLAGHIHQGYERVDTAS